MLPNIFPGNRERQKASVEAFVEMKVYCNESKGTELEDKPIPQKFFSFLHKNKW